MPIMTTRRIIILSVVGVTVIWLMRHILWEWAEDLFDWVKEVLGELGVIWLAVHLIAFGSCCYFYWAATNYVTIALWRGEFLEGFAGVSSNIIEAEPMSWGQYFACYCVTGLPILIFGFVPMLMLEGEEASHLNAGKGDYGIVLLMPLLVGGFGFLFFGLLRVIAFFLDYG